MHDARFLVLQARYPRMHPHIRKAESCRGCFGTAPQRPRANQASADVARGFAPGSPARAKLTAMERRHAKMEREKLALSSSTAARATSPPHSARVGGKGGRSAGLPRKAHASVSASDDASQEAVSPRQQGGDKPFSPKTKSMTKRPLMSRKMRNNSGRAVNKDGVCTSAREMSTLLRPPSALCPEWGGRRVETGGKPLEPKVRFHIIGNARIKTVCKSQSCMVSKGGRDRVQDQRPDLQARHDDAQGEQGYGCVYN